MINRKDLEATSLRISGIKDTSGNYAWIKVLDSFEMYVLDSDESVTPCLVRDGYWESWITVWILNNLQDNTVFIDIGANTGYYSFIAKHHGSRVVAFEPNPSYSEMMLETINRNGWDDTAVYNIALSDFTGDALLNVPENLHGSASLSYIPGYDVFNISVKVFPFDEVYLNPDPEATYMVKIDAESEEERIIYGMKDFLSKCNDITIILEYTPYAYTDSFLDYLFENWQVSKIGNDGLEFLVSKELILESADWSMLVLKKKNF